MQSISLIFWTLLLWVSLGIVFYSYLGYGLLCFLWLKWRKPKAEPPFFEPHELPTVALIIAAYNESDFIDEKLKNTDELNYPREKLRIILVTDGSTDDTPQKVAAHAGVELFHLPERRGKAHAVNRVVAAIDSEIVVFCDANTYLNEDCLLFMVRHYRDPRIGGVAGEKRVMQMKAEESVAAGEGLYWKYESTLKKMDSAIHTVVGAAGELFSVRRALFVPVEPGTIIEDFVLTMKICEKGYLVKYEPHAYALETASVSMEEERKRKIRIGAGAFQAMHMLRDLLNWQKHGITTFQYVSHRVLRWAVSPVCLLSAFIANLGLVFYQAGLFYDVLLGVQILFYLIAVIGYFLSKINIKISLFYIAYYFVFMNLAVIIGYFRYKKGQQSVLWEKAKRQKVTV